MDKFKQYKLKLTDKNKELVKTYLQKMQKIVEKYNIEKELYNDIEEMIFEKLSNQKNLDQLSITKILKEVGEPEVIFADYIVATDNSEKFEHNPQNEKEGKKENLPYYEKLIKSGWTRDNENAIIYGISGTLAQKADVPTWFVRILLIIFTFTGLIIVAYFVLGVILPIKGVNYKGKTNWEYLRTQLYHSFTDFFHNIFKAFKKIFVGNGNKGKTEQTPKEPLKESLKEEIPKEEKEIKQTKTFLQKITSFFASIFNFILNFLKNIMKNILPILRFITFSFISFILFGIFMAMLTAFTLTISPITFNNIDYISVLPVYAKGGFFVGTISFGIFLVASIIYAFTGKGNKYWLILGFVSFVVMIFLGLMTSFSLINTYGKINSYTQEAQIELDNDKDITFNIGTLLDEEYIFPLNVLGNQIDLESTTGTTLKMEIKYKFLGNDYLENTFKGSISKPELVKKGSIIEFENSIIFSDKIPYIPFERRITIYVPEGYTIKFEGYIPYIPNTYMTFDNEKYKKYSDHYNCLYEKMWYSADEKRFVCLGGEGEINEAKRLYLMDYVIKNFDDISPITHINTYKRDYINHYSRIIETSDWDFRNLNWRDKDTLEIEFGDMSLNLWVSLDATETETGAIISNFRINSVNINEWNFEEKYYNSIEAIKEWLPENYKENLTNTIETIDENYNNDAPRIEDGSFEEMSPNPSSI